MLGTITSAVEIVQLTPLGIWIAWGDQEFFLNHDLFPWFRKAPVDAIFHVVEETPDHLYWPDLDIDLDRDRIEIPEKYPLVAKVPL